MNTTEYFFRGEEKGREQRKLQAETYNAFRLLYDFSKQNAVFVPIRSMQYMAVIDKAEIIFVDANARRRFVESSWQDFDPHQRDSLMDPVPYTFVYFDEQAIQVMPRLLGEFPKALKVQAGRLRDQQITQKPQIIGFPQNNQNTDD